VSNVLTLLNSGRKITQDGQRDLDRIAMTLAEESDEE
jgi:small subunit ribosomal protein S19e